MSSNFLTIVVQPSVTTSKNSLIESPLKHKSWQCINMNVLVTAMPNGWRKYVITQTPLSSPNTPILLYITCVVRSKAPPLLVLPPTVFPPSNPALSFLRQHLTTYPSCVGMHSNSNWSIFVAAYIISSSLSNPTVTMTHDTPPHSYYPTSSSRYNGPSIGPDTFPSSLNLVENIKSAQWISSTTH